VVFYFCVLLTNTTKILINFLFVSLINTTKMLLARYGVEGGQVLDGGCEVCTWWRDIAALRREPWFGDNSSRSIENKNCTSFWSDVWVGGVSLRSRFSRLFDLAEFKGETVSKVCQLGWGIEGDAWRWRRRLFAWEEEQAGELTILLQNVNLQVDKDDMWHWFLENSRVYSVRSAYHFLRAQPLGSTMVAPSSLWNKDIPLKVVLFAWRLFRDRLSTKDNLFRHGVIDHDSRMCVSGVGSLKNSSHLIMHCRGFGLVWNFIYRWIGISMVTPCYVVDHFNQFTYAGGGAKTQRSIMQVLWFATVWEIWKERNNRVFNAKECSILEVVDKIKALSYVWLKAKFTSLPLNFHGWWLSPLTLLGTT